MTEPDLVLQITGTMKGKEREIGVAMIGDTTELAKAVAVAMKTQPAFERVIREAVENFYRGNTPEIISNKPIYSKDKSTKN